MTEAKQVQQSTQDALYEAYMNWVWGGGMERSEPRPPYVEPAKPYIKDGVYVCQETFIPKVIDRKRGQSGEVYT